MSLENQNFPTKSMINYNRSRRKFQLERNKKSKSDIAPLNQLPLLPSGPGGVHQELIVPDLQVQK